MATDPIFSQHDYLLRTNAAYAESYARMELLRSAKLIEAIAIKLGLSIDPNTGDVSGLNEKEQKKLAVPGTLMGAGPSTVKEAVPVHKDINPDVAPVDLYATVPDPDSYFSSEAVGKESGDGEFAIDPLASGYGFNPSDAGNAHLLGADPDKAYPPNDEQEEATKDQTEAIAETGSANQTPEELMALKEEADPQSGLAAQSDETMGGDLQDTPKRRRRRPSNPEGGGTDGESGTE